MELAGGNPYRARAYGRAAENLALSPLPLPAGRGRPPHRISGIGDALAGVISQLHETGEHPRLEAMREEVPDGVLDMLRVPGLRRERVQKLYKELGINPSRTWRTPPAAGASRRRRALARRSRPRCCKASRC